ncbi:MAG TPA: respiratory nitrate reductase subunit gamma [Gammaproteobacteria bacterium]|nr:respiratory nitrate reductase subunit gamma [Gammaproteobacteria bacterium]
MMYLNNFFFEIYPYLSITVFIIGSLMRFNYAQYGWTSASSQFLSTGGMSLASNLFHVGLLLLMVGHFFGLLTPEFIYEKFISVQHKQMLAMVAGGVFGSICFVGMTMLVYRRLFNPRIRSTGTYMDIFILLLIYLQLILGLCTIPISYHHSSGVEMVAMASWLQHIITFRASGASQFLIAVPLVYKLHIICGFSIILIFPFTRLVHVLSFPIMYFRRIGYQVVRRKL